jgi:hypothetical protein
MHISDSTEGRTLLVARCDSFYASRQLKRITYDQYKGINKYKGINHIVLERIEMNESVISSLTRLMQLKDRKWLSLKMVDCPSGIVERAELEIFVNSLSHVKRLWLQTTPTSRFDTSQFFFPIDRCLRTTSLRLCVSNFDESLSTKLAALLKTTKTLLGLSLSGSRRCSLQSDILAQAFQDNTSFEMLDLGDCQLNDDSMSRIVAALSKHPKLKKLDMSYNSFSDQTLHALNSLLLQEQNSLQVLDLNLQRRPLKISLLAPALAQQSTGLKQLYLSNCGLADEETFPIVDALTQNQQLETLDISNNRQLSDRFLLYLGERLPKMQLKILNIRKLKPPNGSPAAMIALRDGLRENTTLQLLKLLFWKETRPASWIQIYVNLNRGGRRALEEKIPLSVWPLVLERAQYRIYYCPLVRQPNAKEDAMFHLFRNTPALWQRNCQQVPI